MKKVLVTGAAGIIGVRVVKYLLSEGKYEITLLDLKNKRSVKRLKRYSKRVNIVYGDVNDEVLINALVKDHDVVIHLAGTLPPFANIKKELCKAVDYGGTENVVNSIRMYNPKCQLLYISSTSVYGREQDNDNLTVNNDVVIHNDDYYSLNKYNSEKLIKGAIKNFVIYRIPIVLGSFGNDLPMYNLPKGTLVEFVTASDVALALVSSIDKMDKLNKKTFNLSGGINYRSNSREYLYNMLKIYGLSIRLLVSYFLVDKNFYSGYYADGDELENILNYQRGSLNNYFKKLNESYAKKRIFQRVLGMPFAYILSRKIRKE